MRRGYTSPVQEFGRLETLFAGFGLALVLGYLAERLKLFPIIGYLLAGIAIGPHTPGFVGDQKTVSQLAETE